MTPRKKTFAESAMEEGKKVFTHKVAMALYFIIPLTFGAFKVFGQEVFYTLVAEAPKVKENAKRVDALEAKVDDVNRKVDNNSAKVDKVYDAFADFVAASADANPKLAASLKKKHDEKALAAKIKEDLKGH